MDIQLFVGNLYVSNKSEDSIPQLLLDLCSKQKNFSNVENEDMSCILYMYTYYICMYVSYILYIIINIISFNSCNYNYNIKLLNFILTMFQTS